MAVSLKVGTILGSTIRGGPMRGWTLFWSVLGLLPLACSLDIGEAVPRSAPGIEETDQAVVRVRFLNLTASNAVDVEFFATNEPIATLPDDLFLPANRITASIGVAGTGILEPANQDTIDFPCTPTLTLGTLGGSFVDNETGEPLGMGTARWAQEQPLGLCGGVVTFVYSKNNEQDGSFRTRMFIGPLLLDAP